MVFSVDTLGWTFRNVHPSSTLGSCVGGWGTFRNVGDVIRGDPALVVIVPIVPPRHVLSNLFQGSILRTGICVFSIVYQGID